MINTTILKALEEVASLNLNLNSKSAREFLAQKISDALESDASFLKEEWIDIESDETTTLYYNSMEWSQPIDYTYAHLFTLLPMPDNDVSYPLDAFKEKEKEQQAIPTPYAIKKIEEEND